MAVIISKKGVCGYAALKNDEMRVENGSGAVCCLQAERRLNFPAGNLSAFIHLTRSKVETRRKGPFGHNPCGREVSHCPVSAQ